MRTCSRLVKPVLELMPHYASVHRGAGRNARYRTEKFESAPLTAQGGDVDVEVPIVDGSQP
ncbi:MAG: hypothetical protein L0H41_13355 [Microlunatus sp.]|nr:hypothetical protein [Microlunatus sp.]MDN5803598.1 hypothetical protein [Microlunatus sp.]